MCLFFCRILESLHRVQTLIASWMPLFYLIKNLRLTSDVNLSQSALSA